MRASAGDHASQAEQLKGQMLATALDAYFSDPGLGGNKLRALKPIGGLAIDLNLVCAAVRSKGGSVSCTAFENAGPAFGNALSLTIGQMLTVAAGQSSVGGGTWYGQSKSLRQLAIDAFNSINNQVALSSS
jgi:hypothetical protein